MRRNEYRDVGEKRWTASDSKMNDREMFGIDEEEWREYKWCSQEKKGMARVENCFHICFLPTFFMAKIEITETQLFEVFKYIFRETYGRLSGRADEY